MYLGGTRLKKMPAIVNDYFNSIYIGTCKL